jgi:hypothetical protein
MAETTSNTGGDAGDLNAEDLDAVAGGAFHAQLESGSELGTNAVIHPGTLHPVGISEACLNPQPLPP